MRADPEASDLLAAVGRECGATSRWGCIKTSGPLSQLIALLTARTTFNMSESRLSSTHETGLEKIEVPMDTRDDCSDQGPGRDLEERKEEMISRGEETFSPIYEVWNEFGSVKMGLVVLTEIWRGRWQT